jgi:hypothetical protein
MGQFANTIFSALLGWVQTAASWLWGLVRAPEGSGWLRWLLDHWLPLVLLLCAAGVVIDFLVYLLRWQPYRVWARFLHRKKDDTDDAEETAQPVFQRKWLYADGSTTVEDVHEATQEKSAPVNEQLDAPIRPTRRVARHTPAEKAYNQPVYPPQWQHEQQGENE